MLEGEVREIRLPTGEDVLLPGNIVWAAAGNAASGYSLQRTDAASRDRWLVFKFGYMPHAREFAHCLAKYQACPQDKLDQAITILNKIRESRFKGAVSLSKVPSTRAAERIAMLLNGGCALEYCLKLTVVNQYDGHCENPTSEAGRVKKLIDSELANLKPKADAQAA